MANPAFGRIITAMVTPFTADGAVDFPRTAQLARRLVDNGSDSLVVCGTTGESPTLTVEEKLRMFEVVKNEVGNVPVIAGTGTNCTRATVDFSLQAAARGVDAILVVAPYYNKPPQNGLYEHFRTVAQAVDIPVVLYNIPGRTGVEISPEVLAKLALLENVVAVKEALPSLEPISSLQVKLAQTDNQHQQYCSALKEKYVRSGRLLEIYSGDDSATLPMLAIGAYGVISVASHVAGALMQELFEAFAAGETERARSIHERLYPLFTGLFATTNPILPKAALALQGFPVGGLRAPLPEASAEQIAVLRAIMQRAGVL